MDYAATKAAINNLTVNLASDLGPRGIRVNAVAPGPIWTPLNVATRVEDDYVEFGANTPLGRAGQPSEVAGAFVFLASRRRPATSRARSSGSPGAGRSSEVLRSAEDDRAGAVQQHP